VFIHHTTKSEHDAAGNPLEDPFYGSQWLRAHIDTSYQLKRGPEKNWVSLYCKKDRGGEVHHQIFLQYDAETDTAFFDHHAKGIVELTSTAKIAYEALAGLGLLEKSEALDRLTDFVTKIDNRLYPAEDFLKSGKTFLGLQREVKFENLVKYFQDHESPREELNIEELEKYGLKEASVKQQKIIDEAMATLEKMLVEGKVVQTAYGAILINENNELKVGASAAYVKCDGILNLTPEKSFAVTLKEKDFDENALRKKLSEKFQGKIIRGKMWIYNEAEPLILGKEDIISSLR
ncbi:MAG: hypothetical protein AAB907_03865, partial [Patescibacteria group bacterium]